MNKGVSQTPPAQEENNQKECRVPDYRITIAKAFFDEGLSPQDWVNANKDKIYCWSLDEIECDNEDLMGWINAVTALLTQTN